MEFRSETQGVPSKSASLVSGLDHVAVAVEDLEQAITWYCDYLGFELLERRETAGKSTSMSTAFIKSGAAVIVLTQGHEPECQINRYIQEYGPGTYHIALAVTDLDAALAMFPAELHPEATPVVEGEGIRQVFLKRTTGSGVRIELIERKGGDFSDESVAGLFRAFEERDLF